MEANSAIYQALSQLGVPFERIYYRGNAKTFVTYQLIIGQERYHAEDEHGGTEYQYRVSIFSQTDYIALLQRVCAGLREAGFYDVEIEAEFYESETGYYHIPIQAKFMEVE